MFKSKNASSSNVHSQTGRPSSCGGSSSIYLFLFKRRNKRKFFINRKEVIWTLKTNIFLNIQQTVFIGEFDCVWKQKVEKFSQPVSHSGSQTLLLFPNTLCDRLLDLNLHIFSLPESLSTPAGALRQLLLWCSTNKTELNWCTLPVSLLPTVTLALVAALWIASNQS